MPYSRTNIVVSLLLLVVRARASAPLDDFLLEVGLPQHKDVLLRLGYDDISDWSNFEDSDVTEFLDALGSAGVPIGHIGKLRRAVASMRSDAAARPEANRRRVSSSTGTTTALAALRFSTSSTDAVIDAGDASLRVSMNDQDPALTIFAAGHNVLRGNTSLLGSLSVEAGGASVGGDAAVSGSCSVGGTLAVAGAASASSLNLYTDGLRVGLHAGGAFNGALSSGELTLTQAGTYVPIFRMYYSGAFMMSVFVKEKDSQGGFAGTWTVNVIYGSGQVNGRN